jgi:hypothetical protein
MPKFAFAVPDEFRPDWSGSPFDQQGGDAQLCPPLPVAPIRFNGLFTRKQAKKVTY